MYKNQDAQQAITDAVKNYLFYTAGLIVTVLLIELDYEAIAWIMFVIITLIVVISLIQSLISLISNVIIIPAYFKADSGIKFEPIWELAVLVSLVVNGLLTLQTYNVAGLLLPELMTPFTPINLWLL